MKKHEEWIVSEENQRLLKELTGLVGIEGLLHVGVDFGGLERVMEKVSGIEIVVKDPSSVTDAQLKDDFRLDEDVEAIWEGSGGDVEGKSGGKQFEFRAYGEKGWRGIMGQNLKSKGGRDHSADGHVNVAVERAVRLHVGLSD